MEINKDELLMMMREFWAIDNNDDCQKATIIFAKRNNLTEKEIAQCFSIFADELPIITLKDDDMYQDKLQEQLDYYSEDD